MRDSIYVQGYFIAELRDPVTGLVTLHKKTPNVVTNGGKNLIARFLLDNTGYDVGITYHAVGIGTTAVTVRDVALDNEYARAAITTRGDTTSNIASFFTFFSASDVTVEIEEVGVFGHSTAVSGADSGILFARALLNIDNTGGQDLTLSYVLSIN